MYTVPFAFRLRRNKRCHGTTLSVQSTPRTYLHRRTAVLGHRLFVVTCSFCSFGVRESVLLAGTQRGSLSWRTLPPRDPTGTTWAGPLPYPTEPLLNSKTGRATAQSTNEAPPPRFVLDRGEWGRLILGRSRFVRDRTLRSFSGCNFSSV